MNLHTLKELVYLSYISGKGRKCQAFKQRIWSCKGMGDGECATRTPKIKEK